MFEISKMDIHQGELYAGYACDETIRAYASSGGIVSCILIDLLERGQIDSALVSRITSHNEHISAVTVLAHTREEVLQNAGSSYIDTPVLQKVRELKIFLGRVAIVALPCQATELKAMMTREPELQEKFFPVIGLFCRGNVTKRFFNDYFLRCNINPAEVESVKVAREHLKGKVIVRLRDGGERSIPFMSMNAYRLIGIHAKALCAWCDEHTAREADISVGDIFMPEFKRKAIKHSAFIARSKEAAALLQDMHDRGILTAEYVGIERYRKTFARVERFGDRLAPRYAAARLTGLKSLKRQHTGGMNLFHFLAWTFIFVNSRLSRKRWGRRLLFALPSWVISLTAFVIKGLSRL
jgi:coenzyme F420-reducing hydrogenase beta subunit